jgi:hypothetical protein
MIDMRMGQKERVEFVRIVIEGGVDFIRLVAGPMKQTAIKQDLGFFAVGDKMTGAGDASDSA